MGGQGARHPTPWRYPLLGQSLRRFLNRQDFLIGDVVLSRQLQIIEQQLQLRERRLHSLGGTTEAPTLQSRNLGDEFRNHLVAAHDQTLQRLDVIGQRVVIGGHATSVERDRDKASLTTQPPRVANFAAGGANRCLRAASTVAPA